MFSPGVIARLGLGTAVLLCAVNVTLLAAAAWDARHLQRKQPVRSLVAEDAPAVSSGHVPRTPHFVGIADPPESFASRR
jgi:hypothetical protein